MEERWKKPKNFNIFSTNNLKESIKDAIRIAVEKELNMNEVSQQIQKVLFTNATMQTRLNKNIINMMPDNINKTIQDHIQEKGKIERKSIKKLFTRNSNILENHMDVINSWLDELDNDSHNQIWDHMAKMVTSNETINDRITALQTRMDDLAQAKYTTKATETSKNLTYNIAALNPRASYNHRNNLFIRGRLNEWIRINHKNTSNTQELP